MIDTLSRADLLGAGWTARAITRAVDRGHLLRVRRGHYATPSTPSDVVRAVRVGGRVTCLSELRLRGVWVPEPRELHIHVAENAARLRDPDDPTRPLGQTGCVVHWSTPIRPEEATASHVSLVDALVGSAGCLEPWFVVAAMDSILNRGLLSAADLAQRLAHAPARVRELLALADPSADSGLETLVRLLVRALGLRVRIQARFPGIGVADVVVEDWIVVETDGSGVHDVPVVGAKDRRRDARHAAAGRIALRFRYAQVVHELPTVAEAIIGAVRAHRRVRNSGELARRAEIRLARLGIS